MRKKLLTLGATLTMTVAMSMTAFAGWQQDSNGWWWQNNDGSWPANSWQWLDGNNDGVSECYYFNGAGYMLANTTTPDGYTVNADGAWTVNGAVQTKSVGVGQANTTTNTQATGTGWFQTETGAWKYRYADGRLASGTVEIDGQTYIFSTVTNEWFGEPTKEENAGANAGNSNSYIDAELGFQEDAVLEFINILNEKRAELGRSELEIDETLMEATRIRAKEMHELYGHNRPDGRYYPTVLEDLGVRDNYGSTAENGDRGHNNPERAYQKWYNSTSHRVNMHDSRWTKTGIACHYDGDEFVWVQIFAAEK